MRLYAFMQGLAWPRSYVGKILLLCFVSTHMPLLAVVAYAVSRSALAENLPLILVALAATLAGTAFAFLAVGSMLKPVRAVTKALDRYASDRVTPDLPMAFGDEAGRLMTSVQSTVERLEGTIGELRLMSVTDALTGARNRRWLNEAGIPEFERLRGAGALFSILVIDLDDFKQLNDTAGHAVGDQILMTVVDAMRGAVRGVDQVVRTGGDEFCVFLPGADGVVVLEVAERIRTQTMLALNDLPDGVRVTLSIGGATLKRDDRTFTDLYRRADASLYRAKHEGRNRVVVA